MRTLTKFVLFTFCVVFNQICKAQSYWLAETDSIYSLDLEHFKSNVANKKETYLPLPDGGMVPFAFESASVLPENLAAKYGIACFNGICPLDNKTSATLTIFENQIFASIKFSDKQVNIKPKNTSGLYLSQWRALNGTNVCEVEESLIEVVSKENLRTLAITGLEQIRNYTIAISATGEYVAFHGGTKAKALAAIATTLNRVNSIYNADLGINLILHPNTDKLIYTQSSTDPYNNTSASAILNVAQKVFDDSLGKRKYDLGHIFSTGAGGLADLNTVCTSSNASGVTGTNSPVGDFYDVDFVCHEIGHQFGADHTFNGVKSSCAGNLGKSRYEIGSGSTIMGYAGICGTDNLQSHSDPYFHIQSIKEIRKFIATGAGSACGYFTASTNNTPEILSQTPNGYVIPISTPFYLTGKAKDVDGDKLLFNWEQMDLGLSAELNKPAGSSPLFRSFLPITSSTRYLPTLPNLMSNLVSLGEILPNYSRDLNFSFNVRDQKGSIASKVTSIKVSNLGGPFTVSYPKINETFLFGQSVTIQWDPAKTNLAPFNCQKVMLLLSYDNGKTFLDTLLSSTPNDGSELIQIPNISSTQCRIMIMAVDNIFFAVNAQKFTIKAPLNTDFNPLVETEKNHLCTLGDLNLVKIKFERFNFFSDTISYQITSNDPKVNLSKSMGKIHPKDSLSISVSSNSSSNENFSLNFVFTSGKLKHEKTIDLQFFVDEKPEKAMLLTPTDLATNVSLSPSLQWEESSFYTYSVRLFAGTVKIDSLIKGISGVFVPKVLTKNTEYTWQVETKSLCGTALSDNFTFTTGGDTCLVFSADTLPVSLKLGVQDFYNRLYVSSNGIISEISVVNLKGEHEWTSDLNIYLESPSKQEFLLFSDICGGNEGSDFDLNMVDIKSLPNAPCPPIGGGNYKPISSFDVLLGKKTQGLWTLHVKDIYPLLDEGILTNWGLKFCVDKATLSTAPSLINNNISYVAMGGIDKLNTKNILAWDDLSQLENITFSLVGKSSNILLFNGSIPVLIDGSFSQADLISSKIGVQMSDSTTESYLSILLSNSRGDVSDTLYHKLYFSGKILSIEASEKEDAAYISQNPAQDKLLIYNYLNQEIRIYDTLGKLLMKGTYTDSFSLDQLVSGIYFVQLENGRVLKFEKE